MSNALTQLADHEATIERGLKTFVEVGNALAAIRDGKLYRESHKTFAEYCESRWGWTQQYATQICRSAETVKMIEKSETTVSLPASERQARPLTKLPADEQADAWEEVVAESEATGEKITAKKVEQVVARRRGKQVVLDTDTGEAIQPDKSGPKSSPPASPKEHIVKADASLDVAELLDALDEILATPKSLLPLAKAKGIVARLRELLS